MGVPVLVISAKIEEEIANIDEKTKSELKPEELLALGGLTESGLSKIIRQSRNLLKLNTFYTVGPTGN